MAVPPCDFEVYGTRKTDLKVPPDEQLPYLRASVAVEEERGTGPLRLDIPMKRGVWVTGRIIDKATGKPARGQVEYFVYNDNPHLKEYPIFRWARLAPASSSRARHFVSWRFLVRAYWPREPIKIGISGAVGSNRSNMYDTRSEFSSASPEVLAPSDFNTLAEIDPTPGTASLSHDLQLETGRTLSVTVLGLDGKPLPGTLISGLKDFQYTAFWQVTPADASTHTVEGLKPGKPRVLTFAHQAQHLTGELVLKGDETAPQKVTLKPWGVLTGRVVNADGEPWGEAEFHSILPAEGYPKVAKDGRFKIVGLIPGKPYTLQLVKDYVVRGTVAKDVKVGPGEVRDVGDLVLQPPKSE